MTGSLLLVNGSLRAASTTAAVLRTAAQLAPAGTDTCLYEDLGGLPHFNPDDDHAPLPPPVADLRAQVHAADGLVFCVPEYAGALPGSFKNLLDWTIGDDQPRSIDGKPVGWLNSSPRGASAAHASLRAVLTYASGRIIEAACIEVPVHAAMVGTDGLVADPDVRRQITGALAELVAACD